MKSFSWKRAAALAAMGLALAGCSHNSENNPPASTTVVSSQPAPAPPPGATVTTPSTTTPAPTANAPGTNNVNAGPGGATGVGAATADAVNKAIHSNVQLTGSRITAVVDAAGVATLTGTAQNQQQKALAVRAATNTSGVTSVKDKIEIVPTGGAKSKTASTTKVIHQTKVIVEQAPAPPGAASGAPSQGNAGQGAGASTPTSGSSAGASGQSGQGAGGSAGSATPSGTNAGGNGP